MHLLSSSLNKDFQEIDNYLARIETGEIKDFQVLNTYFMVKHRCHDYKEFLDKQVKILGRVANRETSTHYFLKKADFTDQ